jgi:hypothetical protein
MDRMYICRLSLQDMLKEILWSIITRNKLTSIRNDEMVTHEGKYKIYIFLSTTLKAIVWYVNKSQKMCEQRMWKQIQNNKDTKN